MAGAVQRPPVDPTAIDAATAPMVARLQAAMAQGDDGTLREVIAIFEEHGFALIGAHQLVPDLLPKAGVHTKITPPDLTVALIAAQIALADMGDDDLGQAMVLQDGVVIAREDARGTAAMLQDLGAPATGAILFKAPKPKQILQADMPLIGPDTAIQSADAGLMGIVIPHGGVMVLDLPQVIATLDAQGMFLWVAP